MSDLPPTAMVGLGWRVPAARRGNDDPVFDWLRAHPPAGAELFDGLRYRRVLDSPEGLTELMTGAAQDAMAHAGLAPHDIDMLLGYGSVSAFNAPNDLALVHDALTLSASCRVMPINSDYTNHLDALTLAHQMVSTGLIRRALVVCGNNWTHHVDYRDAVALAASDGAGAAVVARPDDGGLAPGRVRWGWIDWDNETCSQHHGALRMVARVRSGRAGGAAEPLMTIDADKGLAAIRTFGFDAPGRVVRRLLARHGLRGSDITLVSHQSSQVVEDHWRSAIQPAHMVSTLADLGDMVSSSVAVNLARCEHEIQTDHLVLMGIGMEMHATALLYRRLPPG